MLLQLSKRMHRCVSNSQKHSPGTPASSAAVSARRGHQPCPRPVSVCSLLLIIISDVFLSSLLNSILNAVCAFSFSSQSNKKTHRKVCEHEEEGVVVHVNIQRLQHLDPYQPSHSKEHVEDTCVVKCVSECSIEEQTSALNPAQAHTCTTHTKRHCINQCHNAPNAIQPHKIRVHCEKERETNVLHSRLVVIVQVIGKWTRTLNAEATSTHSTHPVFEQQHQSEGHDRNDENVDQCVQERPLKLC